MTRALLLLIVACAMAAIAGDRAIPPVPAGETYGCVITAAARGWNVRVWTGHPDKHSWDLFYSSRPKLTAAMKDCDHWMKAVDKSLGKPKR